ncbi:hypothetical protein R1sor_003542 [Riccia sorocarpa]|uniref:Uncharacterized protein n=1 Tax=Riccia sorocarpa TaxID=122646 RepID=A0ABD3H5C1_9MARC
MVACIEVPEHFRQVMGGGQKTKVGGKCMSKAKAFHIMASHLRNVNGFPDVTGEEMKKRFERYVSMYKKAWEFKDSTGRGLSEKEVEKGMTIHDKLEKICSHFDKMHAILGQRANAEESSGLPKDIEILRFDSQPHFNSQEIGDGDFSYDEENSSAERVTTVEPEEFSLNGPSGSSVAEEPPFNLVDVDYGSDDGDDDFCEDFLNETVVEDENQGSEEENQEHGGKDPHIDLSGSANGNLNGCNQGKTKEKRRNGDSQSGKSNRTRTSTNRDIEDARSEASEVVDLMDSEIDDEETNHLREIRSKRRAGLDAQPFGEVEIEVFGEMEAENSDEEAENLDGEEEEIQQKYLFSFEALLDVEHSIKWAFIPFKSVMEALRDVDGADFDKLGLLAAFTIHFPRPQMITIFNN